jgi:hypothetical protein
MNDNPFASALTTASNVDVAGDLPLKNKIVKGDEMKPGELRVLD